MIDLPDIKRVVLDLDDVLNSFTMHALQLMGADVTPFDYHLFPVECGYDIISALTVLTGKPRMPLDEFWDTLDEKGWSAAPESNEFWLLEVLANIVGRENILIGTSPTKSAECLVGKLEWMQQHLPDWCQRQWAITPRKWFLADQNTLLIDDYNYNCDKFRECGGHAIVLPRPWNSEHEFSGNKNYLVYMLSGIFQTENIVKHM